MKWFFLCLVSVAISWCLQRQFLKTDPYAYLVANFLIFLLFIPLLNIVTSLMFLGIAYAEKISIKFDYKKFYRLKGE